MNYDFRSIEQKWQEYWQKNETFKAENQSEKPKFYVLDMFPYPSGAGLHVGHPLGYIASDIYARFKRLKGFNVLHPMGYDSFGLPAEQYAIQTGQHPAITTKVNIEGGVDKQGNQIAGYENQLKKLGLSFDWSREVRTSDPNYYKWTQWIFIQLYNHYYCFDTNKAKPISELEQIFSESGNVKIDAACDDDTPIFSSYEWKDFSDSKKQEILLKYRLTYLAEAEVNWCPDLGTVLANDEVVNGVSERGGYPVIRKKMTQWMMRITAYSERLLQGLETIDWPEPLKESQRNWIGKSKGASIRFKVQAHGERIIEVFSTRPDTIFGVSFLTLAPENELVKEITTEEQRAEVEAYIEQTAKRSERDRMADVKTISGVFTGAYAQHPFTKEPVPIWIGDYVLAGYGTGAVMAVPAGDQRDYDFAKHFNLPVPNIFNQDISEEAFTEKQGFMFKNSEFLNGLGYEEATERIIKKLEEIEAGTGTINYRLRNAVFSRQRYWGEPVPAYFKDGLPQMIPTEYLPLILPEIDEYLPTKEGNPPLGRAKTWAWDTNKSQVVDNDLIDNKTVFPLELNTMPGWAGSSWYFNRYMDAQNSEEFASQNALNYWQDVDLYIGGSEHATGHLLYARFWQKFLFDVGLVPVDEFAKKLINQGMILGNSAILWRVGANIVSYEREALQLTIPSNIYISNNKKLAFSDSENLDDVTKEEYKMFKDDFLKKIKELNPNRSNDIVGLIMRYSQLNIHISNIDESHNALNIEKLKKWRPEYADAEFVTEKDGNFYVQREVEKMSKSKYNVLNPDDICEEYGADTLRMYEMFLGPLEQSKPWNTQGLSGVHNFLKKLWKLFYSPSDSLKGGEYEFLVVDEKAMPEELKILHQTIKKVEEDIQNFSFNTSVSTFMIAVNELTKLKSHKKEILQPLLILISPYAPHICEELWSALGNKKSISFAEFPVFEAKHLVESSKEYPISFNGKVRFKLKLPSDLSKEEIEKIVMEHERTQKQLNGREPKKIIVVPGKIVNVVG